MRSDNSVILIRLYLITTRKPGIRPLTGWRGPGRPALWLPRGGEVVEIRGSIESRPGRASEGNLGARGRARSDGKFAQIAEIRGSIPFIRLAELEVQELQGDCLGELEVQELQGDCLGELRVRDDQRHRSE